LDEAGKQLGFKCFEDWYKVKYFQLVEKGGIGLLKKYEGSPSKLVTSVYSQFQWNFSNFKRNKWSEKLIS
jgi:hypothetical protein